MAINKIDRVVLHEDIKNDLDNKATKQELNNAVTTLENSINEVYQGITWKPTVSTFDDLRIEYPDAKDGWTANVGDTNVTYQYDYETDTWFPTSINALPLASENVDGLMKKDDKAKLDSIEYDAQKNLTANQMLEQIKTVDGEGSGLDADLLQGKDKDYFAPSEHNHDGQYYKQIEVNTLLNNKANKVHRHNPSDIETDEHNRLVSDVEKSYWNSKANIDDIPTKTSELLNDSNFETTQGSQNKAVQAEINAKNYTDGEISNLADVVSTKWEYDESIIKNVKVNKAIDSDTVSGKTVQSNVPLNAKFTDTTYSEISVDEIEEGVASTLRVITGRRVKYILDKMQGWINSLTKTDIGLANVDNVKQASKTEFDNHSNDSVRHITNTDRTSWDNKAEVSDIPTKVGQLENDKNYITQEELGNVGYGDMLKDVYDKNGDGKVDVAELADSVPWSGVAGKPATFAPSPHNHTPSQVGLNNVKNVEQASKAEFDNHIDDMTHLVEIPFQTYNAPYTEYPTGLSYFHVGTQEGYPESYGVVVNYHINLHRFTQFFYRAGDSGKTGFYFRHYHHSSGGWTEWKKVATEDYIDDGLSSKVDKVDGKGLSSNDYTTAEKNKLSGIQAGAQVNSVTSVAGKTGAVTVTKGDIGLGNVQDYGIATKAEAESGVSNNKYMTPLRVKESIEKNATSYHKGVTAPSNTSILWVDTSI